MTTNPEQEARAAARARIADKISSAISQALAADEGVDGNWPAIDAALDRLCTERYLAGKVEALKRLDSPPAHSRTLTLQIHDAEAEYAACVAALREAK